MKKLIFLITTVLLISPQIVIGQEDVERLCNMPYSCQAIGVKRTAKTLKFATREAYLKWFNETDRADCDAPFYATSAVIEVICYDGIFKKQCKDDYGFCIGG